MTISCPSCRSTNSKVGTTARRRSHGKMFTFDIERVMRNQRCRDCGHRWTTVELPVELVDVIFGVSKAMSQSVSRKLGRDSSSGGKQVTNSS